MSSLVLEIQKEAVESSAPVGQVLRKVLAASSKLGLNDIEVWARAELKGYNASFQDLPDYRQLIGDPRAYNHVRHEWQPLRAPRGQQPDNGFQQLAQFPLHHSIFAIEKLLSEANREIIFNYPQVIENQIQAAMEFPAQIGLTIPASSLVAALEAVRDTCLNWALELEKNGILGEGMAFSKDEKEQAKSVVLNVNANTVGSLSYASDNAQIQNDNRIDVSSLSTEKLAELIAQLKDAAPSLPEENREEVLLLTNQLEEHKDDPEKASGILGTIKDVCVGASGNLTAQGIVGAISALL